MTGNEQERLWWIERNVQLAEILVGRNDAYIKKAYQDVRSLGQRDIFGTVFGDRNQNQNAPKIVGHVVKCDGSNYSGVTVKMLDNSDHTTVLATRTTDANGLADFGNPSAYPAVFDLQSIVPTGARYAGYTVTGASMSGSVIELGFGAIHPATDTVCTGNGWYPPTLYLKDTKIINNYVLTGTPLSWNATYGMFIGEFTWDASTQYLAQNDSTCTVLLTTPQPTTTYFTFSPGGVLAFTTKCCDLSHGQYGAWPSGSYPPTTPATGTVSPATSDLVNLVYTYNGSAFITDGASGGIVISNKDSTHPIRVDSTP